MVEVGFLVGVVGILMVVVVNLVILVVVVLKKCSLFHILGE